MKKNKFIKDAFDIATGAVLVGATNTVIDDSHLGNLSEPTKAVVNVGFLGMTAKKLNLFK